MKKNREVVLWQNDDPEWNEDGQDKEQVVAVHSGLHGGITIRCDTAWGFVDWPSDAGFGIKWDFPYRFSQECKGAAVVAYRALEELNELMTKYRLVVDMPTDKQKRYHNLFGLFYPEHRRDDWINYLETE